MITLTAAAMAVIREVKVEDQGQKGINMKRLLVTCATIAAFSSVAVAADVYDPAAAAYDWTGPYVGAHVGYLWGDAELTEEGLTAQGSFEGFIGGIVAGANYQSGNLVFGAEGDFGLTDADGTGTFDDAVDIYTYDMDWNAHLRGRVGLAMDNTLFFVAGGLALTEFHLGYENLSVGGTYTGWTIGGGFEHAFSDSWVAGAELLYDDYGSKRYDFGIETIKVDLDALTVRAMLKFNF